MDISSASIAKKREQKMVTPQRQKTKAAGADQLLKTEMNVLPGYGDFLFNIAGTRAEFDAQLLQGSCAIG